MNCSPNDLKDFVFGELGEAEREAMRSHLGQCRECREELERLQLTEAAMHALAQEEIPRRIAFVSDAVMEPRWWRRLWQSGPRLGFASAAMLALALLFHAVWRPAAPAPVAARTASEAAVTARLDQEAGSRVEALVRSAMTEMEARQEQKTQAAVAAVRREVEFQRQADRVAFQETLGILQKKYNVLYMASADLEGRR
jgi:anti-sigma factor RsiW